MIYINDRQFKSIVKGKISYDEIMLLSGLPKGDYQMTYSTGIDGEKGELFKGGSIPVTSGLIIKCHKQEEGLDIISNT